MTKIKHKTTGSCAYPGCKTKLANDSYCHGCKNFVCDEHSTNHELPWGGHVLEAHWEEDEEWDENDDM